MKRIDEDIRNPRGADHSNKLELVITDGWGCLAMLLPLPCPARSL